MGGPESREHSPAKLSGTTLPGPAHSLKDSFTPVDNPAHEALIQGITQQKNLLGTLVVVLHIVADIVLRLQIIQCMEALIQGITQQHILVACQILQIILKVTLLNKKVTTLQKHHQYLPPKLN